jgi:hypothetical protein
MTPLTNDRQKDMATAEKFCRSSSFTELSISPMLAFSYRDYEDDWRMQYYSEKLMDLCESVRVFCDEVTEMMIHMIKYAMTKKLPIEFYDASGNHINYDALIINKRIGPGYRKMIVMSHGDLPASGVCPHCGSSLMTEAK